MGYSESDNEWTTVTTGSIDSYNDSLEDESEEVVTSINEKKNLIKEIKVYYRLVKKYVKQRVRKRLQQNFTNIIYLTIDCPEYTPNSYGKESPMEYISEMRKQYPENDIRLLLPILGLDKEVFQLSHKLSINVDNKTYRLEKTAIEFEFYTQNHTNKAILYKYEQNEEHIEVYGIFCPLFSFCSNPSELSQLQHLAPFIKAVRLCIKQLRNNKKEKFAPDIVHCENIPFYLGTEFENNLFNNNVRVLQIIKDFTQIEMLKTEPFWAVINLADKSSMAKLCNDSVVRQKIAKLFNLHTSKQVCKISECLQFIYKNYTNFRKYIDKGEEVEENAIFNDLNKRVLEIFPQIRIQDSESYNIMQNSILKSDYWATVSKTYYKEIIEKEELSGRLFDTIQKTKEKSGYVSYGFNLNYFLKNNQKSVYQEFSSDDFRETREKNKEYLLKELSFDRIKTKFMDSVLFKNEDYKIIGNLDTFYGTPVLFANPSCEIFANGIDILFNTILKLFEQHKTFQVIICIKDGLKNKFVKSWIDLLSQNSYFKGRWIFIDGEVNIQRFLAGSDMVLIPRRVNMAIPEHYLAMHYGCIPIISKLGILNDTAIDIYDDISHGCSFKTKKNLITENNANEIYLLTVIKALNLYQNNPLSWNLLIKNCLSYDSNWTFKMLEKYDKIYKELI